MFNSTEAVTIAVLINATLDDWQAAVRCTPPQHDVCTITVTNWIEYAAKNYVLCTMADVRAFLRAELPRSLRADHGGRYHD